MSIYSDLYKDVDYPVICTRGVIVFPGQDVIIDVGRSTSVNALLKARTEYDSLVWIVTQKDIMVENPDVADLYSFGTLCSIKHLRQERDVYKVKFHGLARAQMNYIVNQDNMFMANISVVDNIAGDAQEEMVLVKKISQELEQAAKSTIQVPSELVSQINNGMKADALSDLMGQYMPMQLAARQEILETINVNDRLLLILQQINVSKEIKQVENNINAKVKENIDESQKEYYLRERLRAIKEELGDTGSTDDIDELRARFENNPYPENVKQKAFEEISRMEMMPSASQESSVIRNYLDWLEKVPWWQKSEDREDINEISNILEEDHYGLEKVKERILEYIAVAKMTDSLNAPILCLVGPPGVGKTSLAKSIARSLDRKFVKISLGGVHDEAEIRGHRRTYLGSMPGRIIQGMKKAGTTNPVFLIDELDKMGADYKGDPSSAMLEVLDPEQNSLFSDNFLEEPYDLSNVLFIATANDLSSIPSALRDRLEIIEMSSYTEE